MPRPKVAKTYLYSFRHPGLFLDFYFPKRVVYQAEITTALKEGVDENEVKEYLSECARELPKELATYPYVLDPQRYTGRKVKTISLADVKRRIEMYRNPFFGWSTHDVEGAFLNPVTNELQDELTQVVRVIFRFDIESLIGKKKEYGRMVQSATSWLLINYYHRLTFPASSEVERDRFIFEHGPFSEDKLAYIRQSYPIIATEVLKWFDDCILFTFGYLARRFWKQVAEVGRQEDEIWVTSFYNVGINMLRPGK